MRPYYYKAMDSSGNMKRKGIMIQFMDEFSSRYNICYKLDLKEESDAGTYDEGTDTFSGNLGYLQRKEYDVFLTPIMYDSNRYAHFDFTDVVEIVPVTAVYSYPILEPDYLAFVKAFDRQLWLIIGCILVFAIAVSFFNVTGNKEILMSNITRKTGYNFGMTLSDSFLPIWRGFLSQAIPELDVEISSKRILLVSWILTSSFLTMSYKSNLKATLIIPKVVVPFNNFEEMFQQTEVQWILTKGTVFSTTAKNSPKNSILRKIYDGTSKFYINGLAILTSVQTGKYAYITHRSVAEGGVLFGLTKDGTCTLTHMKGFIWPRPTAFAFRKNSQDYYQFNTMLRGLIESGILNWWNENHMSKARRCIRNAGHVELNKNRAFVIEDVGGIFGILIGGHFLALCALIIEVATAKLNKRDAKMETDKDNA